MKEKTVNCPSCGAAHDVHNPGIMMFMCAYCGTAVYWDQERLEAAGKQSVLPDGFSRLFTGAAGSYRQKRFVVMGRARYAFERGFWDEWYLEFADGTMKWLTEDNHEFSIQMPHETPVAAFEDYRPGSTLVAREISFVVQETGHAECIGIEGDLPKVVTAGETYPYVDASSLDGRYLLSIEYDEDTPSVFLGRWLKYGEISLDDEGVDW